MACLLRVVAVLAVLAASAPSPQSLTSDLTILIDNDLSGPDSPSLKSGVILLSRRSIDEAVAGCEALGEQLWRPDSKLANIQSNLNYLKYQGKIDDFSKFWVAPADNGSRAIDASGSVGFVSSNLTIPALCTQSAPYSNETTSDTNKNWQVAVYSNDDCIVGYRDRLSFRFLGIRYAPQPARFEYPSSYRGLGRTVNALSYGPQCYQMGSGGSEDCLFLNIWTPYLPQSRQRQEAGSLKPVMFWIHGGAFLVGTSSDPVFDGGNIASRGDVVLVAINYRLANFGFLALNDSVTNGNYGLADQITALDWVRRNIKDFGGDPDRITIFGQSAGAASVRALMASPKAVGKFAAAILLSNLGGIQSGTTYSKYYTIEQEVQVVANGILTATNCSRARSQVDCLRTVPAATLSNLNTTAQYLVVDGTYLTSNELELNGPRLPFELMMGIMRDDGASFVDFPNTTDVPSYLTSVNLPMPTADLFPMPDGSNQTLDLFNLSSRIATDGVFRCVDQATVYTGINNGRFGDVYYYEFGRSYPLPGWPMTDVCEVPKTTSHPYGDPSLPYFRCHSGDIHYVFGNLGRQGRPMRDEYDLPFEQLVLDSFASFARKYDPNPDPAFLTARGYSNTDKALRMTGLWKPSTKGQMALRVLDWPSHQSSFAELAQCQNLGLGLDYYSGEHKSQI